MNHAPSRKPDEIAEAASTLYEESSSLRLDPHFQRVAQAFSRKAGPYDAFAAGHPNLERMRRRVYRHVLRHLRPGDRILEINAGTGIDAAFFASLGYRVHATDIAPGMLAAANARRARPGMLTVEARSFTDLEGTRGAPFDYIFSNFGGLNCIADLRPVAGEMHRILRPGGRLTWTIMPPVCPWDLAFLLRGELRLALRRLKPGGALAHVEGVRFPVHYYTPRQVLAALGPAFRCLDLEGLSIVAPPADRKGFALRHPRLYRWLARADEWLARLPLLRGWGDFFILTAEYRPA
jgi:SAM-dependent methyltransferase